MRGKMPRLLGLVYRVIVGIGLFIVAKLKNIMCNVIQAKLNDHYVFLNAICLVASAGELIRHNVIQRRG